MLNLQCSKFSKNSATPFSEWSKEFTNYLIAIDGDDFSERRKIAIMRTFLDADAQFKFDKIRIDKETTLADVIQQLTNVYDEKTSITVNRKQFRARRQMNNESISDVVDALARLSHKCAFGDLTESLICDQVIEGTTSMRIRERLLMEDELTLGKLLKICKTIEQSSMDATKFITDTEPSHISEIRNAKKCTTRQFVCYRCGSSNHLANSKTCPAIDKSCRGCGKTGHFAAVCRSNRVTARAGRSAPIMQAVDVSGNAILSLKTPTSFNKLILPVSIRLGDNIVIHDFVLDTGAAVSIVPYQIFRNFFPDAILEKSHVCFKDFSGNTVKILGRTFVSFVTNGITYPDWLYVNNFQSSSVL